MGDIKDADAVGTVGNPACGDVMRLYIKVDGDKITEAKFKTFGCGAAIATSSMATEMIKDKSLEEAEKITNEAVAEALDGLPPNKMHCSVLAQEAIEAAIKNYKEKK
jgi:nitrogen fixation NifU-like protein